MNFKQNFFIFSKNIGQRDRASKTCNSSSSSSSKDAVESMLLIYLVGLEPSSITLLF